MNLTQKNYNFLRLYKENSFTSIKKPEDYSVFFITLKNLNNSIKIL